MTTLLIAWNIALTYYIYLRETGKQLKYPWITKDENGIWISWGNNQGSIGRRVIQFNNSNQNKTYSFVIPHEDTTASITIGVIGATWILAIQHPTYLNMLQVIGLNVVTYILARRPCIRSIG